MDYGPWGHKESDTTEQLPAFFRAIASFELIFVKV